MWLYTAFFDWVEDTWQTADRIERNVFLFFFASLGIITSGRCYDAPNATRGCLLFVRGSILAMALIVIWCGVFRFAWKRRNAQEKIAKTKKPKSKDEEVPHDTE